MVNVHSVQVVVAVVCNDDLVCRFNSNGFRVSDAQNAEAWLTIVLTIVLTLPSLRLSVAFLSTHDM